MKLKTRLAITFLTVILVPAILLGFSFWGLGSYQIRKLEKKYGVKMQVSDLSDTMRLTGKVTQPVFEQMLEQNREDPGRFYEDEYLDLLQEDLSGRSSFLLMLLDDEVYYDGSGYEAEKQETLLALLPEFHFYESTADGGIYLGDTFPVFVKQMDIAPDPAVQGSVFIVTQVPAFRNYTQRMALDLTGAALITLFITAAVLSFWIYTSINKPIKKLSEATHRIRNEDFDFHLEESGADEFRALCRDFEEMRRKLQEQSERKDEFDRQSKELISNISHDLKTPVTAVKGYVEGIMDGVADTPQKMDRYIRTIYAKANDMDRLINELTFYSRIDTNRIPYSFNRLNVQEYFDDCAEDVGLDLRERGIMFSYLNTVADEVEIIADAEQLTRVINNIISNSAKYMDKKNPNIEIRVKDVGDFIQIEIEDNGRGIAQEDLPYVFERFYRTDASRSSAGGSGIGLSIVKKIVEDHGGRIWVNSRPGEGTTMFFVIRKYVTMTDQAF